MRTSSSVQYILPVLLGVGGVWVGDYLAREAIDLSTSATYQGIVEFVLQQHPLFVRLVGGATMGATAMYCSSALFKGVASARSLAKRMTWE